MKLAVADFYFIKLNNVFRAVDGNGVFVVGILSVDTIEHSVDFYLVEFSVCSFLTEVSLDASTVVMLPLLSFPVEIVAAGLNEQEHSASAAAERRESVFIVCVFSFMH